MAGTHTAYNLMKMSGSKGVLTMAGDTKEALVSLKLAFRATTVACSVAKAVPRTKGAAPTKQQ